MDLRGTLSLLTQDAIVSLAILNGGKNRQPRCWWVRGSPGIPVCGAERHCSNTGSLGKLEGGLTWRRLGDARRASPCTWRWWARRWQARTICKALGRSAFSTYLCCTISVCKCTDRELQQVATFSRKKSCSRVAAQSIYIYII